MTEQDVQDFVTRFAAAWAARDGEAFLALWHADGVLHSPLYDRPVAGKELGRLTELVVRLHRITSGSCSTGRRGVTLSWSNGRRPERPVAAASIGAASTSSGCVKVGSLKSASTSTVLRSRWRGRGLPWSR